MEKYFKISESELRELLRDSLLLQALDQGGVDNWDWYGASIKDFLASACSPEENDFTDLAEHYLNDYQEVE